MSFSVLDIGIINTIQTKYQDRWKQESLAVHLKNIAKNLYSYYSWFVEYGVLAIKKCHTSHPRQTYIIKREPGDIQMHIKYLD